MGYPNVHPSPSQRLSEPAATFILPHRAAQALSAASKGEEIRLRIFMVRACTPKWRFGTQAWLPSGHGALI
jgi:hypothetical protein